MPHLAPIALSLTIVGFDVAVDDDVVDESLECPEGTEPAPDLCTDDCVSCRPGALTTIEPCTE